MSEANPKTDPKQVRHLRRWLRGAAACAACLVLVVVCLPSILSLTPLRNSLLQWLAGEKIEIATQTASFGWFTPLQVEGLRISDSQAGNRIEVAHIGVGKPLLTLLFDAPRLGTVTIDRLRLDLVPKRLPDGSKIDPGPPDHATHPAPRATFRAEVSDAAIVVRDQPKQTPVVDLAGFNLMLQVEEGKEGRVLSVDPTDLLSQQELSVDLCHRGLQLIAPILANSAQVDGKVSLRLDKLRVTLDQPSDSPPVVEVDGHLVLHRVSAGLRNPLLTEIAQSLSRLLRAPLPRQVKLAEEADVHFWVAGGRVFHEGLAFGLPEISPDLVMHTHGSVGLDRTLDLLVDVPLPLDQIHDGPILRLLSERPLQLQVRGTLEKPIVSLPADRPWYRELAERLAPSANAQASALPGSVVDSAEPLADAVLESLGTLLERRRQKLAERSQHKETERSEAAASTPSERPAAKPLLDRLRNLRNDRRNRNEPVPTP